MSFLGSLVPCFGFLVTSPLGFIHVLCGLSWRNDVQVYIHVLSMS